MARKLAIRGAYKWDLTAFENFLQDIYHYCSTHTKLIKLCKCLDCCNRSCIHSLSAEEHLNTWSYFSPLFLILPDTYPAENQLTHMWSNKSSMFLRWHSLFISLHCQVDDMYTYSLRHCKVENMCIATLQWQWYVHIPIATLQSREYVHCNTAVAMICTCTHYNTAKKRVQTPTHCDISGVLFEVTLFYEIVS